MAENRDITAGELLELLADDEMIEGGYDRDGMVALLLLARAALEVQAKELNDLGTDRARAQREAFHRGRKEAAAELQCAQPALEQLLSMAAELPRRLELIVTLMADGAVKAGWWEEGGSQHSAGAIRPTYQAAIRAATCELLGLEIPVGDRQTCDSCQHWRRSDEPATEGGARPCGLDEERDPAPRHPASLCARPGCYEALEVAKTDPAPDSDSPPLKGVTQPANNLIRSEGGDDV
jgi:hypothetical protein